MTITLTKQQVRGMSPADYVYKTVSQRLPGGDDTPFTPSEMALFGVPHQTIVWAFLRPDVLGAAFGDVVCRIAETVLPAFEKARPGDTGPCDAIAAARVCFTNPTPENRAAAARSAYDVTLADADAAYASSAYVPWESRAAAMAATAAASYAAHVLSDYTVPTASRTAYWAVHAGCPRATILSIIEGAGQ